MMTLTAFSRCSVLAADAQVNCCFDSSYFTLGWPAKYCDDCVSLCV